MWNRRDRQPGGAVPTLQGPWKYCDKYLTLVPQYYVGTVVGAMVLATPLIRILAFQHTW